MRTTFVSKPGNFAKKPMPEMLRLKIIGDSRASGRLNWAFQSSKRMGGVTDSGLEIHDALAMVHGPDHRLAAKLLGDSPCNDVRLGLFAIYMDGTWMAIRMVSNVRELRPKPGDSEKVTINLGYVDLGQIDLMVHEGFYSNRTDFIRTAIRNQLDRHADVVKQSVARNTLDLGLRHYTREDLEAVRASRQPLHLHVLGLLSIAADVSPELARAAIASLSVLGSAAREPGGQDRIGGPHAVVAI